MCVGRGIQVGKGWSWLDGGVRLWDVGEFYGKFDKNWCARTFSCTDAEPYIHIEGGTLCLSNLLKL